MLVNLMRRESFADGLNRHNLQYKTPHNGDKSHSLYNLIRVNFFFPVTANAGGRAGVGLYLSITYSTTLQGTRIIDH